MIPGEVITPDGDIELNSGAPAITLKVANTGDRPIQVWAAIIIFMKPTKPCASTAERPAA